MPTLKLSGICPGAQMRRGRRRWPEAQLLTLQLVLATIATVTADALHGRQLAGDVFVASLLLIGALLALTLLSAAALAFWQVEKVCSSVSFGNVTFVSEDPLMRCAGVRALAGMPRLLGFRLAMPKAHHFLFFSMRIMCSSTDSL